MKKIIITAIEINVDSSNISRCSSNCKWELSGRCELFDARVKFDSGMRRCQDCRNAKREVIQ